jgi:hypothetical protein
MLLLALALLLALPLLYLGAAIALGLSAVNDEWQPTPEDRGGVPVCTPISCCRPPRRMTSRARFRAPR